MKPALARRLAPSHDQESNETCMDGWIIHIPTLLRLQLTGVFYDYFFLQIQDQIYTFRRCVILYQSVNQPYVKDSDDIILRNAQAMIYI